MGVNGKKKKHETFFGVVVVLTKKTLNLKTLNYFCVSEKPTSLTKKKKTTQNSKKEKNEEEETREEEAPRVISAFEVFFLS